MKARNLFRSIAAICLALTLTACQTTKVTLTPSGKGAVELRAMQGRMFETSDRGKTLRTVIATLQDLGYGIEKVEAAAGTVSARKLSALEMTVTVFPRGNRQMIVRANAVAQTSPTTSGQVDAPEFYQQLFFEPLSKALFLAANQDTGDEPPPAATSPIAASPATPPSAPAVGAKGVKQKP